MKNNIYKIIFSSSLQLGSDSHKKLNPKHPWMLNVYYGNKAVMAILCTGNELFYIGLYCAFFFDVGMLGKALFYLVLIPTWAGKQYMNVLQAYAASMDIVEHEYENDAHHKQKKN